MHRAGDGVVEFPQVGGAAHALGVEKAGEAGQAGGGDDFHRCQEVLRVPAVKASRQVVAADGEVERRTDAGDAGDHRAGRRAALAGPLEQRVAAERDAGGVDATPAVGGLQAAQDPVDFLRVARMVGARAAGEFARAAAEWLRELPSSP